MKSISGHSARLDTYRVTRQSPSVLWKEYSARAAADLIGVSESFVRSCVHAGVLADRADILPLRLSFQDLLVVRCVKNLSGLGVSPRRVRRELANYKTHRHDGRSLCSVSLNVLGGHVVIEQDQLSWQAESGQMIFDFCRDHLGAADEDISSLEKRVEQGRSASADDWMRKALFLEDTDVAGAMHAYNQVVLLRPDSTEAWVNLGRIHADGGDIEKASAAFRRAFEIDPDDPTVVYNLGVIAQDVGKDDEAIGLYLRSLELDSKLAEAHYNLATIFDRAGDTQTAIRHIHAYRRLTQ